MSLVADTMRNKTAAPIQVKSFRNRRADKIRGRLLRKKRAYADVVNCELIEVDVVADFTLYSL